MTSLDDERQRWWARSWADDYSWNGLAQKSAGFDSDNVTLQDCWREEEARLIEGPDGRRWTRFHLPLTWQDGSATGKQRWSTTADFAAQLVDLITSGAPIPLNGCVLPTASVTGKSEGQIKLSATTCFFLGHVSLLDCSFKEPASFQNSWFEGSANFNKSCFLEGCRFIGCTFVGGAHFGEVAFFHDAQFGNARFLSTAWFGGAKFHCDAHFSECEFN